MHSAFIWASCNSDQALGAIAGLVHADIPSEQLPEFFWVHLEKDLELLGKDTKKGLEENVMILHLVLEKILTLNQPTGTLILLWYLNFFACVQCDHRLPSFVYGVMYFLTLMIRWSNTDSEYTCNKGGSPDMGENLQSALHSTCAHQP
jgi:hypothetical protein